jgi:hypothetical protein
MKMKFPESIAFLWVRTQLSGLARLEAEGSGDPVQVVEEALSIVADYKKAAVKFLVGKPFVQDHLPKAKRASERLMSQADAIKVIDTKIVRAYEEEVAAWKEQISPYFTREPGSLEFGISPAEEMHRNFMEVPEGEYYEPSEDEYARFNGGLSEEFSDDEIVHSSESSIVGEVTPMEKPDNRWDEVFAKEHELYDALKAAVGAEEKGNVLRRAHTLAFPKVDSGKYGLIRPKYFYFLKTFAEAQLNAR